MTLAARRRGIDALTRRSTPDGDTSRTLDAAEHRPCDDPSLLDFLPELIAVRRPSSLLLLLRLFRRFDTVHLGAAVVALSCPRRRVRQSAGMPVRRRTARHWRRRRRSARQLAGDYRATPFGGLLVYDQLTVYLRVFLFGFAALIIWLSLTDRHPRPRGLRRLLRPAARRRRSA